MELDQTLSICYSFLGLEESCEYNGITLRFSSLAQRVTQIVNTNLLGVRGILDLFERILSEGPGGLSDAICTGFFERLLADSSANRLDFSLIAPLLGKESRAYCQDWDVFTGLETPGL
jgi:hypothetical protein